MIPCLISKEEIMNTDSQLVDRPSSFRKATINMTMAYTVCRKALNSIPDISADQISVVIATHFGEVQSTLDFLSNYNETQTPSPILFQNSLHNSTLGFIAIQLGLTGPALTISLAEQTETSLELLVESLIDLGDAVIICFVDFIPHELQQLYLENFPFLKNTLNKAVAFTFISSELNSKVKLKTLPFEKFF